MIFICLKNGEKEIPTIDTVDFVPENKFWNIFKILVQKYSSNDVEMLLLF